MTLAVQTVSNPEVIRIPLASTTGRAATDTLIICTGTAVFNFGSNVGETRRDTLVFAIPDENGSPLNISPARLINSAATASLSSINSKTFGNLFAVDRVDITQSDAEEGQIFLNTDLAVSNDGNFFRVAYQVNLLVRADSSPPIR